MPELKLGRSLRITEMQIFPGDNSGIVADAIPHERISSPTPSPLSIIGRPHV